MSKAKAWGEMYQRWRKDEPKSDLSPVAMLAYFEENYEPPGRRKDWIRRCAEAWFYRQTKTSMNPVALRTIDDLEKHIRDAMPADATPKGQGT